MDAPMSEHQCLALIGEIAASYRRMAEAFRERGHTVNLAASIAQIDSLAALSVAEVASSARLSTLLAGLVEQAASVEALLEVTNS